MICIMNLFSRIKLLLHKVPRPPEDSIPAGAAEQELDSFVHRTGITLPTSLRQWLRTSNGPCVGPGGLFGIRPERSGQDIERIFDIFPTWKARKWIPIAGDGCGNHYVLPTEDDFGVGFPVVFVDNFVSSDSPAYIVASDLEHFLVELLEKELGKQGWPFDRNHVLRNDPHIVDFQGVALPWILRRR
jgi:hypothetical protein